MFTGLIKNIGTVVNITRSSSNSLYLTIKSDISKTFALGASVSINGACHTVIEIKNELFIVESSSETISKTNMNLLHIGDKVNIEPALSLGQSLDGHLVQGHVDGTGRIRSKRFVDNATILIISAPRNIIKFLVPKGSISIEGVSLTIVDCFSDSFSVCLIPFSANHTTLGKTQVGSLVNLEIDIISKYVERLMKNKI